MVRYLTFSIDGGYTNQKENDSVKVTLLFALEKWMHVRPNKVIECWKYALNTSNPAFGPILLMIDKFSHWETEGIEEILERLLEIEKGKTDDRWVGKAISKNFLENKNLCDLCGLQLSSYIVFGCGGAVL